MMRRFFPSTIRVDTALPFTFTVNTANTSTGSTTNTQFRIPLVSTGNYDFTVDWGDTNSDVITAWDQAEVTHDYGSTDIYTITITGQIRGFSFLSTGDRLKITDISQWGTVTFIENGSTIEAPFRLCTNLNVTATDKPTFEVGSQVAFFESCTSLVYNSSINDWDVSPITSMSRFFLNCGANFNQPIGNWDVSNVNNFVNFLNACPTFNQNLSAWDVSFVTIFEAMFRGCTAFNNGGDAGINDWIVSSGQIFGGNNAGMFQLCTNFNQPIGGWDMSSATSLFAMFQSANSFNQNIGAWNVSNVTNMQNLFFANTAFNNGGSDTIKNWSPSKVTNFVSCFRSATVFNQPIASWVLNSIGNISMNSMFRDATAFNQPLGDWNVGKVTDFGLFMTGKTAANYSATNLDDIYNKWSLQTVTTGRTITFNTIKYTAAGQAGKDILEAAPNNWNITDGGI